MYEDSVTGYLLLLPLGFIGHFARLVFANDCGFANLE